MELRVLCNLTYIYVTHCLCFVCHLLRCLYSFLVKIYNRLVGRVCKPFLPAFFFFANMKAMKNLLAHHIRVYTNGWAGHERAESAVDIKAAFDLLEVQFLNSDNQVVSVLPFTDYLYMDSEMIRANGFWGESKLLNAKNGEAISFLCMPIETVYLINGETKYSWVYIDGREAPAPLNYDMLAPKKLER